MQKGQPLTTVLAVNPPHLADPHFALALALLTLGCQRDAQANGGEVAEFREEVRGEMERRFEFIFETSVEVDGISTSEWMKRWNDPAWLAANPQHPLAWMRRYAANFAAFAEWMKTHDPIMVFRKDEGSDHERAAYVPRSLLGTPEGARLLAGAGLAAA